MEIVFLFYIFLFWIRYKRRCFLYFSYFGENVMKDIMCFDINWFNNRNEGFGIMFIYFMFVKNIIDIDIILVVEVKYVWFLEF